MYTYRKEREPGKLEVFAPAFDSKGQAKEHYSGKKKQITWRVQVCVDWKGYICHVSGSVPGPRADIALLKESGVLTDLPDGVGAWGDST